MGIERVSRVIGFLGLDGVSGLDLSGALEPFATARNAHAQTDKQACYEPVIIGMTRRAFRCSSGAVMKAHYTMETAPTLDTIIIPGGDLDRDPGWTNISGWILERARTTRRIAAIGAGIYPLARSGLLAGHSVTTHWRLAQDLSGTFPELLMSYGVSFLKSGQFYTCGNGISGMEMSLALIEEDCGSKTAFTVGRELNLDLRPPGWRNDLSMDPYDPMASERVAELPGWMTSRLHRDLTIQVLAERTCLSERQFHRLFKQTFKKTPAAFVEELRINEAQARLVARRDSIEKIAASVGFKSSTVFRRAFGRRVGCSPSIVRRRGTLSPAKQAV